MSRVQSSERISGGLESVEPMVTDYAAVPLDLLVEDEQYCSYVRDSLDRINKRVDLAMKSAWRDGWVASEERLTQLAFLVRESLMTSQWERIERNRTNDISRFVDMNDERVKRAHAGTATPLELLSVLEDFPKIESIELAKLSHPLDTSTTQDMDHAVSAALLALGEAIVPGEPRYKRKMSCDDLPAAIILRKQAISEYDTEHGRIQVVSRKAFLTRGDDEAVISPFLERKIRNPHRVNELGQKIEAYLPHIQENFKWLQPIATSYYAKYVTDIEA